MPALGPSVRPIRELPLAGVSALECRSRQQFCALGPPPPRPPGRADPQVPATPRPGSVRHGRIAHLYFYPDERLEDAARLLLKRTAPQEVRDWLEDFLPSEADEAPKAIAPEPPTEVSGR